MWNYSYIMRSIVFCYYFSCLSEIPLADWVLWGTSEDTHSSKTLTGQHWRGDKWSLLSSLKWYGPKTLVLINISSQLLIRAVIKYNFLPLGYQIPHLLT